MCFFLLSFRKSNSWIRARVCHWDPMLFICLFGRGPIFVEYPHPFFCREVRSVLSHPKCKLHVLAYPYMDVSKNRGKKPKSSILIGFSIINHPFWGTNIFGNTHIWKRRCLKVSRLSWSQGVKWRATSKVTSQASYWMRVYKGNRRHLVTTVSLG